jgi:hypothetical protein
MEIHTEHLFYVFFDIHFENLLTHKAKEFFLRMMKICDFDLETKLLP